MIPKVTPKDEEDPGASALEALLEFQRKIESEKKQSQVVPDVKVETSLKEKKSPEVITIPSTPADIEMLSAKAQSAGQSKVSYRDLWRC